MLLIFKIEEIMSLSCMQVYSYLCIAYCGRSTVELARRRTGIKNKLQGYRPLLHI
jgi:hypothetical protein